MPLLVERLNTLFETTPSMAMCHLAEARHSSATIGGATEHAIRNDTVSGNVSLSKGASE